MKYETLWNFPQPAPDAPPGSPGGPPQTLSFHEGWCVHYTWALVGGRPEPTEVKIYGASHDEGRRTDRPVTADQIRKLPLGEMAAEGRARLRVFAKTSQAYPVMAHWWPESEVYEIESGSRRGRRLTTEQLDDVAKVYRDAWLNGMPVNDAVREAFHLSRDGAAKRIQAARAAGLLDGVGPKR